MNPSTSELADAVRATGSSQVVVLPNNKNITPVAGQVDALVEENVAVVATNSIVEGFAALLAYDPDASLEANATAMRASACNVVAGEVTRAVRDSATDAGHVHEGDWIGLGASGVLAIADSIAAASNQLLAHSSAPSTNCSPSSKATAQRQPIRAGSPSISPRRILRSSSKCTTAANPSTPTTSASSE